MLIEDIIHEIAEHLKKRPELSGVPVIEDEKGDTSSKLNLAVGQRKLCILVGWSGFEPSKQSDAIIIGNVNIYATIYETPVVNRKNPGALAIGATAKAVAKALTYAQADGMSSPLFFKRITPITELGEQHGGTVMCDVVFNTKAEL